MLNRIYRDQIAKRLTAAFSLQNGWDDTNGAEKALEWFSAYLQSHLAKCLSLEDGICVFTWKHEDCAVIMHMLHDITGDEKYRVRYEWR